MANTLGQEENLMGQTINKDGFIVPDEERNFTKLLVNLELADNLQDRGGLRPHALQAFVKIYFIILRINNTWCIIIN